MKFVGIDLDKKTIGPCAVGQDRQVRERRRLGCQETGEMGEFFKGLGPFHAVVEATAGYEWMVELLSPLTDRVLLAHPKKLRVIAESTRKSDRLDAEILAEFLALDMIPEAYRPTPRERAHRILVRHRYDLGRRFTSVSNKMRRILSNDNADRDDLFTARGWAYACRLPVLDADRSAPDRLGQEAAMYIRQLKAADPYCNAGFARRKTSIRAKPSGFCGSEPMRA